MHWSKVKCSSPQNGCIGLLLNLFSIHKTETDRRWKISHLSTPPAKRLQPLNKRSNSLWCVYWQPSSTPKNISPKLAGRNLESISVGETDYKILARTSLRYRAFWNLLFKPNEDVSQKLCQHRMSHLKYQCLQTFRTEPPSVTGDALCVTWTQLFISHTHNQSNFPKVASLTNCVKIMIQGL